MAEERKENLQAAINEQPTDQTLPPRPKVPRCANISIIISAISTISLFLLLVRSIEYEAVALLSVVCFVTSGIFGIIGLFSILLSKGKRCGIKRNVLALLLTAFGLWIGGTCLLINHHTFIRLHSTSRMSSLGNALAMYKRDFGCMPKEKWCDILIQDEDVTKAAFRSYAAKSGECHYAFNKHLVGYSSDIPDDVVVLFESKHAGWNQIGGAELMTTTEYLPKGSWLYLRLVKVLDEKILGKGCFVSLGNGDRKFVKPEEYHTLRWHIP